MNGKSIIIGVIIALIVIIAGWYWYAYMAPNSQGGDQQYYNSQGDSTSDISNDLNTVEGDASLKAEMDSLDQELDNF